MKIAIDGLAAVGKSTLATNLAKRWDLVHVDSGIVYRVVALECLNSGLDPLDGLGVAEVATNLLANGSGVAELLRAADRGQLRTPLVDSYVSTMAAVASAREALTTGLVAYISSLERAVTDGRDSCEVLMPDADLKLFLTADVESRAERVLRRSRGDIAAVTQMRERDEKDLRREISPAVPAAGAVQVDTSHLTPLGVADRINKLIASVSEGEPLH